MTPDKSVIDSKFLIRELPLYHPDLLYIGILPDKSNKIIHNSYDDTIYEGLIIQNKNSYPLIKIEPDNLLSFPNKKIINFDTESMEGKSAEISMIFKCSYFPKEDDNINYLSYEQKIISLEEISPKPMITNNIYEVSQIDMEDEVSIIINLKLNQNATTVIETMIIRDGYTQKDIFYHNSQDFKGINIESAGKDLVKSIKITKYQEIVMDTTVPSVSPNVSPNVSQDVNNVYYLNNNCNLLNV